MKKQRYYSQSKEQEESPEGPNNETDLTSLLDPEFKKETIKMLKELRKIIKRNADHSNKEIETMKMNQSKLDNSIAEIKTNLEAMNSRLNDVEKGISDLEDGIMEITQIRTAVREMNEKKKKNESNIQDVWDNVKHANLHIIGDLEEEEREKVIKNVFEEIMAEHM